MMDCLNCKNCNERTVQMKCRAWVTCVAMVLLTAMLLTFFGWLTAPTINLPALSVPQMSQRAANDSLCPYDKIFLFGKCIDSRFLTWSPL